MSDDEVLSAEHIEKLKQLLIESRPRWPILYERNVRLSEDDLLTKEELTKKYLSRSTAPRNRKEARAKLSQMRKAAKRGTNQG